MSADDPTPKEIESEGRLDEVREWMKTDFDRARDLESQSVNELEKSLWLVNSGAATVTLGYLTTAGSPSYVQFLGCGSFVIAIVSLLLMRIVSALNASRDRNRRQAMSEKFFTDNLPISSLEKIRDTRFQVLRWTYIILKFSAAVLFVVGCLLTLKGVYPQLLLST